MQTATELLKIMLESGWNLRLKNNNQFLENNDKNNQRIKDSVAYLCEYLSKENFDNLPLEEIKNQLFDLAVENIQQNSFRHRENWYLFDMKGRPICAIPNEWDGLAFCDLVKMQHGIYLGYGNYFESTKERSLKRWEELRKVQNNKNKLKRKILLYCFFCIGSENEYKR